MKVCWVVQRELAMHYSPALGEQHAFPDVQGSLGMVVSSLCGTQRIFIGSEIGRRWDYSENVIGGLMQPECEVCKRFTLLEELAE